jgi:hypothetical protein
VVADTKQFRIYTNWDQHRSGPSHIALDELKNPATLDILRAVFNAPEKLKPDKTREQVTEEAAKEMYPSPFTDADVRRGYRLLSPGPVFDSRFFRSVGMRLIDRAGRQTDREER